MHYIRFLSPPKVADGSKPSCNVSAVVAVTTDLGDDFFAEDLTLNARLVDAHNADKVIQARAVTWQGRSRALKLVIQAPGKYASRDVCMHVTTPETEADLHEMRVPSVLDVWSAQFHLTDKQRAEPIVERKLALSNGSPLRILEETGDSIARHIWDASLGFLQYFDKALDSDGRSGFRDLVSVKHARPLRIIELGAGCGIVGIAFAQLVKADVLLTDLEDAMEILSGNIRLATPLPGSTLEVKQLDWSGDPTDSANSKRDLVLVSDCIYNPDTSLHLVKTLQRLSQRRPSPLILVGYKRRHSADQVFFDHMDQANFKVSKTSSIRLPHRKTDEDDASPIIEFHEYFLPA